MIKRRTLIQAAAFSALIPAIPSFASVRKPTIGIIGAGIIGSTIAAYLSDAGAKVILFEKERPSAGATRVSFAWISPSTVNQHYRDLRLKSMSEWLRFEQRLKLDVIWGGSISWSDNAEKAKNLNRIEELLRVTGVNPQHVTEADIKRLCPYLEPSEIKAGLFLPEDGHIDPVGTTQKILAYAVSKGAKVLYPCSVDEILIDHGQVKGVRTPQGEFQLDYLVSACGVDTSAMLEKVGVKIGIKAVPGLKIHTFPLAPTTRMVYDVSNQLEWKQMPNGEAVAVYVPGPPEWLAHEPVVTGMPRSYSSKELANPQADALKTRVGKYWPALKDARVKEVIVGSRPVPLDGLPMIGHVPGVTGMYMVATNSGITLAPIIGKFTAQEIMGNERVALLSKYRPERFL